MFFKEFIFICFLVLATRNVFSGKIPTEKTVLNVESVSDMIRRNGYICEDHVVTTPDGYILTIHRIPIGKQQHGSNAAPPHERQIVLLEHGAFQSSSQWVLNPPENSLAYVLADAGFDVWLGNTRGNVYGRKHMTLDPSTSNFYNFTIDEIAQYDIPSTIDYILKFTERRNLKILKEQMPPMSRRLEEEDARIEKLLSSVGVDYDDLISKLPSTCRVACTGDMNEFDTLTHSSDRSAHSTNPITGAISGLSSSIGSMLGASHRSSYDEDTRVARILKAHGLDLSEINSRLPNTCRITCTDVPIGYVSQPGMTPSFGGSSFTSTGRQMGDVIRKSTGTKDIRIWQNPQKPTVNSLFYVGFGQGSLAGLIQLSRDTSLVAKIKLFVGIGTNVKTTHSKTALIKMLKRMDVNQIFREDLVLADPDDRFKLLDAVCYSRTGMMHELFSRPQDFFYFLGGENRFIDKTKIPFYLTHLMSGMSKTSLIHYAQMTHTDRLQPLDYSSLRKSFWGGYREEPKEEFNLRNVQVPTALFSGELDEVATPEDTAYLTKVLPNVVTDEVIHNYGHYDLILAQNLRSVLIDRILEIFNQFTDQLQTIPSGPNQPASSKQEKQNLVQQQSRRY